MKYAPLPLGRNRILGDEWNGGCVCRDRISYHGFWMAKMIDGLNHRGSS